MALKRGRSPEDEGTVMTRHWNGWTIEANESMQDPSRSATRVDVILPDGHRYVIHVTDAPLGGGHPLTLEQFEELVHNSLSSGSPMADRQLQEWRRPDTEETRLVWGSTRIGLEEEAD